MAFVLAFTGKIGSGKTTLTAALARELGCRRASFGDYVRHIVSNRGLEQTRENLQMIGTELLEANLRGFCSAVLRHSGWGQGEALVIDGLRHVETINPIQDLISPARLKIISVAIDEDTRLARLGLRGDGDKKALSLADSHSSEQQVGSILLKKADLVIDGNDPVSENVSRIMAWIKCQ